MVRGLAIALVFLVVSCGGEPQDPNSVYSMSRKPVSVRGWIHDVKGAKRAENLDMELARRTELFNATSVWVENTQFASGGIAQNGAFIILDVPPQTATIGFNAPGAETARLVIENVPGTADVIIPDLVLEPGGATVLDPKAIQVRLPGEVDQPRPTGQSAKIAGHLVPIVETPIAQMTDRREYPMPPGFRPVATVK
jgi:hypothetical protein